MVCKVTEDPARWLCVNGVDIGVACLSSHLSTGGSIQDKCRLYIAPSTTILDRMARMVLTVECVLYNSAADLPGLKTYSYVFLIPSSSSATREAISVQQPSDRLHR